MLVPTPENYARIPEIIRPTNSQILVLHQPSIDLVILPEMREALLSRYRDWMTPAMKLSCDWPYSMAEAVEVDHYDGLAKLTHLFEQHVTNLDNWLFTDAAILQTFPDLAGKIRIRTG